MTDYAKYIKVHQQAMAMAVANRLTQVRQVMNIDEMKCGLTDR